MLTTLCDVLCHPYCAVRHMAARCIAAIATRDIIAVMKKVISLILPLVNAADSVIKRQGGVETITALAESLKLNIIPYIVLLVIPLLGRYSYIRDVNLTCADLIILYYCTWARRKDERPRQRREIYGVAYIRNADTNNAARYQHPGSRRSAVRFEGIDGTTAIIFESVIKSEMYFRLQSAR